MDENFFAQLKVMQKENKQLQNDLDRMLIVNAEQEFKLKNAECELRFYKDYYRRTKAQEVKHG